MSDEVKIDARFSNIREVTVREWGGDSEPILRIVDAARSRRSVLEATLTDKGGEQLRDWLLEKYPLPKHMPSFTAQSISVYIEPVVETTPVIATVPPQVGEHVEVASGFIKNSIWVGVRGKVVRVNSVTGTTWIAPFADLPDRGERREFAWATDRLKVVQPEPAFKIGDPCVVHYATDDWCGEGVVKDIGPSGLYTVSVNGKYGAFWEGQLGYPQEIAPDPWPVGTPLILVKPPHRAEGYSILNAPLKALPVGSAVVVSNEFNGDDTGEYGIKWAGQFVGSLIAADCLAPSAEITAL